MFEPGTKVVCIDGNFTPAQRHWTGDNVPIEGETYTVRDIVPGVQWNKGETVAVYLCEIAGLTNDHGIERGWNCNRFRELDPVPPVKVKEFNRDLVLA